MIFIVHVKAIIHLSASHSYFESLSITFAGEAGPAKGKPKPAPGKDWLQDLNDRKAAFEAEEAAKRAEEEAKRRKELNKKLFKILWNHSARVIQVGWEAEEWSQENHSSCLTLDSDLIRGPGGTIKKGNVKRLEVSLR